MNTSRQEDGQLALPTGENYEEERIADLGRFLSPSVITGFAGL